MAGKNIQLGRLIHLKFVGINLKWHHHTALTSKSFSCFLGYLVFTFSSLSKSPTTLLFLPLSWLLCLIFHCRNKSDQKRSSSSFPHQISNLPAPFVPIDPASLPIEMNVFSVPLCEVNPSTCVLDPFFFIHTVSDWLTLCYLKREQSSSWDQDIKNLKVLAKKNARRKSSVEVGVTV